MRSCGLHRALAAHCWCNWFMHSTVHRGNLLSGRYNGIGIGVAAVRAGVRYYVLNFARR